MSKPIVATLAILVIAAGLSACAGNQASVGGGAPVTEAGTAATAAAPSVAEVEVYALESIEVGPVTGAPGGEVPAPPQTPVVTAMASSSAGPAVQGLLQDASRQVQAGRLVEAVAIIERALRIEPRNGQLWSLLARIRVRQEQYALAESLALKSNTLAAGDRPLRHGNWLLIANARTLTGDHMGARQAMEQARALAP